MGWLIDTLRTELSKIRASKVSLLAFLILFLVFISESVEVLIFNSSAVWQYSTFFNSSTEGHIQLLLLLYLFPVFIIIFYSSKIHREICPSLILIYNKNKWQYFKEKVLFTFVLLLLLMMFLIIVDMLVNYMRYFTLSQNLNFESWNQLGDIEFDRINWPFLYNKRMNPQVTLIVYGVLTAIYFALLSAFVTASTFIFPDIKTVYLFTFAVNMFLSINPFFPNTKIFQPFVEGTLVNLILSCIFSYSIFIILILVIAIIYYYKGDYVQEI